MLTAHVRRLALTHHDPMRDDDAVDRLVEICRERPEGRRHRLDVPAAAERRILEPHASRDSRADRDGAPLRPPPRTRHPHTSC
jgi:hypothetical protein